MNKIDNIFFNQIRVAFLFFIVSASYGWSLRLYKVVDFISIDYRNILQAHSHVTFLGWGFLAVISLIGFVFFPKKIKNSRYLKVLFGIMSLTLLGMLISFPWQGYKLFSIVFLSIFLVASYVYLFAILKELKHQKTFGVRFMKTGIFYYFLSSLAIWVIAIVTVKFGKTTLYFNSIYFYLHFLYNGFFVFTLFGLLVKYLEEKQVIENENRIKRFYWLTNLACIPAYALSLLWTEVPVFVYVTGFVAASLQVGSLFYLYGIGEVFLKNAISKEIKWMSILILSAYFLKIVMQFFSAFPMVIKEVVALKSYFVIGYLHLFTLGFMSLFLVVLLMLFSKIKWNSLGLKVFISGVFLSESLLFLQGVLLLFFQYKIPSNDWLLVTVSGLMPLGLLVMFFLKSEGEAL